MLKEIIESVKNEENCSFDKSSNFKELKEVYKFINKEISGSSSYCGILSNLYVIEQIVDGVQNKGLIGDPQEYNIDFDVSKEDEKYVVHLVAKNDKKGIELNYKVGYNVDYDYDGFGDDFTIYLDDFESGDFKTIDVSSVSDSWGDFTRARRTLNTIEDDLIKFFK
jgi:hypothetical protein